jgi:hypothetical protein
MGDPVPGRVTHPHRTPNERPNTDLTGQCVERGLAPAGEQYVAAFEDAGLRAEYLEAGGAGAACSSPEWTDGPPRRVDRVAALRGSGWVTSLPRGR